MSTYLTKVLDTPTPQTEALDDQQVQNEAGGYVYPVHQMTWFSALSPPR